MDLSNAQVAETQAQPVATTSWQPRRSTIGRLEKREARAFWLLILPWVIGFIAFTGGPILASLALSFTNYTGTAQFPTFIGLQNYQGLFADPIFLKSLEVTIYYVVVSVPLSLIFALLFAMLLNQHVRFQGVFRTIFYIPSVISGVVVSLLWEWILNPDFGLVNLATHLLHIPPVLWFQDERTVVPSFVLMSLWGLGGPMIIFLASLQGIAHDLYEAASIDGANNWSKFLHITIPMLSPAILLNLVTGVIFAFQIFVPAYVITNGGPNYGSEFYSLYLFNNAFQYFKFGYAAGQSWILFLIILVLTILMLWGSRRFVYYES